MIPAEVHDARLGEMGRRARSKKPLFGSPLPGDIALEEARLTRMSNDFTDEEDD